MKTNTVKNAIKHGLPTEVGAAINLGNRAGEEAEVNGLACSANSENPYPAGPLADAFKKGFSETE